MNVLVTGANGTIGTALREHLGNDPMYEFTWMDIEDHPEHETLVADTTDRDAVRDAVAGQDAIVALAMADYLGAAFDTSISYHEGFPQPIQEICYLLGAARQNDAEVVYASSNHAVGLYEVRHKPDIYYPDFDFTVDHETPQAPDSRYGVGKVLCEGMGQLAAEVHSVPFYSLRIGAVRGEASDHPYGDVERAVERNELERESDEYRERVARMKAMWLSRRDAAHLVDCCLKDDSVTYDVFYGVSESEHAWLDISHAKEVLGYDPQDDSSEWDGPPT